MKLMTIAGTRPEFIRLSLLLAHLKELEIENVLVHTGQNFDPKLSEIFFTELDLPEPDHHLGVRSDRVGEQIGQIIDRAEQAMIEHRPDALLILGDTNSGLSAVSAGRLNIPIFHMEAGNRCYDWSVPEEKNRRLIDHISDWLLPYTPRSREHLVDEGIDRNRIFVSGNPITDVLEHFRPRWEASTIRETLGLDDDFFLVTAHRQETVDLDHRLQALCAGLSLAASTYDRTVLWSVHPRTRARLEASDIQLDPRVRLAEPFGFSDFVSLQASASCVISDSGTVQEECSLLGVPSVTCRDVTERPETIECGSNVLCGVEDPQRMLRCIDVVLRRSTDWRSPYADDRGVAERIVAYLLSSVD